MVSGLILDQDAQMKDSHDRWNLEPAVLRLDDLELRDDKLPIKLSIMMSINSYRRNQLARSLECFARQDWREFEILVCDNGSTEDLDSVFNDFRPFLRLTTVRLERDGYSASPTRGFRELLPYCEGEVIAIMQPEIMVQPNVARFLYDAHYNDWPNIHRYTISRSPISHEGRQTWVIPKTGFFEKTMLLKIDEIDWHTDIRAIEKMPQYNIHKRGFSYITNGAIGERREFPCWFIASAKRDADIWAEMPVFRCHASIDWWLLDYRRIHAWVDICSMDIMAYHQWHYRLPHHKRVRIEPDVMPDINITDTERECFKKLDIKELRAICKSYGLDGVGSYEKCWSEYLTARDIDGELGH